MRFSRFVEGKTGWSVFLAAAVLMLFATGSEAAMRKIDFDGDGFGDLAVYRQSEGAWYIQLSSGGSTRIPWGDMASSDIPVAGDYDNDAITDAAVWRPTNGTWYIKNSTGGSTVVQWGDVSLQDVPVPGDYDGDGKTDIAVFRQSTGTWYIMNSSGGTTVAQWGDVSLGDVPVPGDYDGDGKDDIAVWRSSNGTWYVKNSGGGTTVAQWGSGPDWVMPGDYDGDGRTDFAVWRPSTGTWYIKNSSGGNTVAQWGDLSLLDVPMPVYADADNHKDIAVWRRTSGTWYVKQSTDGLPKVTQWGDASEADTPVTGFIRPSEGAKVGIYARWKELVALYATSLPDNTALDPFFHPGFLERGRNKAAEIASWVSGDGPGVGLTFSHLWVQWIGSPNQYLVGFQYSDPSGGAESVILRMAKNGTAWTMYGDQTPFETNLSSASIRWVWPVSAPTYFNGLLFWASDNSSNFRPDIQSIKATGPGLPPAGVLMNRDPYGWFQIAGTGGDLYALEDATIDAMGDIGAYAFQYYSGTNGSGTLLNTSNQFLRKRPVRSTELSAASFPTLVSPTSHALSAANPGGVLNVSWTNPSNTVSDWTSLKFDASSYSQDNIGPTQTSTSFDSTGIGYTPTWGTLQIEIKDRYDRMYELGWQFQ